MSHHPPVSAFYAECQARNISFTGNIYTKSAFLGLSVAVSHWVTRCHDTSDTSPMLVQCFLFRFTMWARVRSASWTTGRITS